MSCVLALFPFFSDFGPIRCFWYLLAADFFPITCYYFVSFDLITLRRSSISCRSVEEVALSSLLTVALGSFVSGPFFSGGVGTFTFSWRVL